jgi:hypothetical protein
MREKLTRAQRSLLKIAAHDHGDQWEPRFDTAHPKHQSTLLDMRVAGLVTFSTLSPRIRITEAGLAALKDPSNG